MIPGGLTSSFYAGRLILDLVFAANESDVNLATKASALGWNGVSPVTINVTINAGVVLSASNTTGYGLDETGLVIGSVVNITNNGKINGAGGAGGAGGFNAGDGSPGSIGGNAFRATVTTNFNNASGEVNAGSGGNGGSAATRTAAARTNHSTCSGSLLCLATYSKIGNCANNTGATGATGGALGATGATGGAGSSNTATGQACAALGCPGFGGSDTFCGTGSPGAGGLAGKYVVNNSFVNWISTGTRRGGIG